MNNDQLRNLKGKIHNNLTRNILPFWSGLAPDDREGGFYGRISVDNKIEADAPKGVILNTRLLWAFSRAFAYTNNEIHRDMAERAYDSLIELFTDRKEGGLYWLVSPEGDVLKDHKQSYAQAFAIYAFSEYYKITKDENVRTRALTVFEKLEDHARDRKHGGYVEALSRQWEEMDDVRLSDVDQNEKKSNNTHLHIMEAYTNLYQIAPVEVVREALEHVTLMMMEKIYDPEKKSFTLFFTEDWQKRSEIQSFGHDIEAAWLIREALLALENEEMSSRYRAAILDISKQALEEHLDGPLGQNGMNNESDPEGHVDRDKIWWVQNEALIGFLSAYQISGRSEYLEAAANIWNFCEKHLIDHEGGEWWNYARNDGVTQKKTMHKADEWKCPYHNSRACIESIERINTILKE